MQSTTTFVGPHAGLVDWLASHDVEYEIHEHPLAFTARETANVEGVDPRTFAKIVALITDDGRRSLIVVDSTDHLDLRKARKLLGAHDVRLLTETELTVLAPTCEMGAIPAVGQLFDVPLYADFAVRDDEQISFNAGSHRFSVRVERDEWERATGVCYADLADDRDPRPAWSRS
jgi:Ala-tRNA(Pro) deacylase